MSKYPQRALAERNKTVQMKNSMEDKILRQKLESFSRERGYIDRELRRISLARESLVESLDRYTKQSKLMTKRLSLPCLVDERRKDSLAGPIGGLRRHTVDIVEDFQRPFAECKQPLKPLGCIQEPAPDSKKVAAAPNNKVGLPSERKNRAPSPLLITSMETSRDILEFRCTSPVTASLTQSGVIPAQEADALFSSDQLQRNPPSSSQDTRHSRKEDFYGSGKPAGWNAGHKPEKQVPSDRISCNGDCDFKGCKRKAEGGSW